MCLIEETCIMKGLCITIKFLQTTYNAIRDRSPPLRNNAKFMKLGGSSLYSNDAFRFCNNLNGPPRSVNQH